MQKDGWAKYIPNFALKDANMIRQRQKTRMKMLYGCPFEKIHFLPKIDANSEFGRD